MARTIGQIEKGILLEDFADTRDLPEREISREIDRPSQERERISQTSQYDAWLGKGLKWYTNPRSQGIGYDSPAEAINAARLADIVNDDSISISKEMLDVINDETKRMTENGEIAKVMPTGRDIIRRSGQFRRDLILPSLRNVRKPRRKASKYQKELGKQLKMLKKKHPRTAVTKLMKRAHRLTKKKLK